MTPGPVQDDYPGGREVDPLEIEELKRIQRERDLFDVHLVSLGTWGFSIAHTESERVDARSGGAPLEECELHLAMCEEEWPPHELGVYVVEPHVVDGYSESYRGTDNPSGQRWDWTALDRFVR